MAEKSTKPVPGADGFKFRYEANRICLQNKSGKNVGEITFPDIDDKTVDIDHTYVDPSLRGQGLAAKLLDAAVDLIRSKGKKAVPTCSYVVAKFEENKDYQSLQPW